MHYTRWRRHGDPVIRKVPTPRPGSLNGFWRGDDVGYGRAHERVRDQRGLATQHPCADCGGQAAHWAYDHLDAEEKTSAMGPFSTDPCRYRALCVSCHKVYDLAARRFAYATTLADYETRL
jgi:hypothetical protein